MHVVVVGAGIVGAAVAEELARRGATVTVLDMRSPGRGASHASAGILAPHTEAHEGTPLLDLGTRSLALYDSFVARLGERTRRAIDYARSGTLEVALDAAGASALGASRAWLAAIGVPAEWMTGADLRSFEPALAPDVEAALFKPHHGWVGVQSLIAALTESARLAGATFESPIAAVEVVPHTTHADVRAVDRRYTADTVVVAAGSWSGQIRIAGIDPVPIRPVRGQLLHLEWPATPGAAIGLPSRVVWGADCYVVPWPDGSVLVGATVEEAGFDERVTLDGVRTLADAAGRLLPRLRDATFLAARVGLRPAAPDGLPVIGPFGEAPRVVVATGHYRNGVLLAPVTAVMVADLVLDGRRDPALDVTTPDRFGVGSTRKNREEPS